MIVKLRRTVSGYADLSFDQEYVVIGVEADDLRILNDQGKPYLYPRDIFEIVDATEPGDWHVEIGEDGERYAYPPALDEAGFFEDFFDRDPQAVSTFWRVINRQLARAA